MRPPGSKRSAAASVTATRSKISQDSFKEAKQEQLAPSPSKAMPERVYIRLHDSQDHDLLRSLKQSLDESKGTTEVVLVLGPSENKQIIKLPSGIQNAEPVLSRLQALVGADNIKIQ